MSIAGAKQQRFTNHSENYEVQDAEKKITSKIQKLRANAHIHEAEVNKIYE